MYVHMYSMHTLSHTRAHNQAHIIYEETNTESMRKHTYEILCFGGKSCELRGIHPWKDSMALTSEIITYFVFSCLNFIY